MKSYVLLLFSTTGLAVVLTACVAAERPGARGTKPLAGWYMQSSGGETFQPCGESTPWRITDDADLRAKAKSFGLDDGNPVYVKIVASLSASDKTVKVDRVIQFGSPTPVRDCAMTGVVHPAPTSAPAPAQN